MKEKSDRSFPMSYDMFHRKTSTSNRIPSRSNMSVMSDDTPRLVQRSSSMRSSVWRTPVGFGSSTPRKCSMPIVNGNRPNVRTMSNSSIDTTPLANR